MAELKPQSFSCNHILTSAYSRLTNVTRGHNIVADGWAGASNPHQHPNPLHTQTYTRIIYNACFPHFNSITMDR